MDKAQMLQEPFFTVNDLAERYKLPTETITYRINKGEFVLPDGSPGAYRFPGRGRAWRILKAAVDYYESRLVFPQGDNEEGD